MRRRMILGVALACCALPWSAGGYARPSEPAKGAALLDAIVDCRSRSEQAARLACYDRASADLVAARETRGLQVVDAAEGEEKRRSVFGLAPAEQVRRADVAPPIAKLDGVIARVTPFGRDNFTLTLSDNSVWRTTDGARISPAAGDSISIRRAAMSSYLASFGGARGIRIKRLR